MVEPKQRRETQIELSGVADCYTQSVAKHGPSAAGVGWGTEEAHLLRLQKLMRLVEGDRRPLRIADLGCGYGALYDEMRKAGVEIAHYEGVDIAPAMIDAARAHIADGPVTLTLGSEITQPCDYAFASGIFNVRMQNTNLEWEEFVIRTIDKMDHISKEGFGFNCLTSYVDWKDSKLYYGSPEYYFSLCKKKYGRFVSLLHDYPLFEWTILVKKRIASS